MDKYCVDRIEENIVVLENISTGEIIEMDKTSFDFDIDEGNILVCNDGVFSLDKECEESRRSSLRERLNRLKRRD